jgi:hypothetical protein
MNNIHDTPFASMVWFLGVVEDINDPEKLNRVRVRCISFHSEDKAMVPSDSLAWASIVSGTAKMSAPMVLPGDWVIGFFLDAHEAQQPIVLGSFDGITPPTKDSSVGFNDPSGVYPKRTSVATTSPLARGEDLDGVLAYRKGSVAPGEPVTPAAPVYPHNHVIETDKLNIIELDDTPGAERVHIFHKSGTFYEVHPDGKLVVRSVADAYEAILANKKLYVAGDLRIEVVGDATIATNGNAKISAGGKLNVAALADINFGTEGNINLIASGNVNVVGSKINLNSGGSDSSGGVEPVETMDDDSKKPFKPKDD